jgi:NhaA family Na+:H+ antiporter
LLLFNKKGVKNIWAYLIPGIFMWYFIHHSGIHATIAGILTALALPTTIDDKESPLEKLERYLTKPVNFLIVPLFALTNTNITVYPEMAEGLFSPLGLGIIFGLIVGKSLGIFFTCFAAVKTKLCRLPEDATWKHIAGVGLLGGIGFTMSIFVSLLSFSDQTLVEEAKLAVLITSLSAGILGYTFLYVVSKREKRLSATTHVKISNKKL